MKRAAAAATWLALTGAGAAEPRAHPAPAPAPAVIGAGQWSGVHLELRETLADELTRSGVIGSSAWISAGEPRPDAPPRVTRFVFDWHLGGGGSGFDGGVTLDAGQGLRTQRVGHALMMRGIGRAQIQGNDDYYLSLVQIPQLDLGYQFLQSGLVIELSGRGALLWDGRFRGGGAPTANLDFGPSWGALAELGTNRLAVTAQWLGAEGVTSLTLRVCSTVPRAFSTCVRGERWTGDAGRDVWIAAFALGIAWLGG